MTNDCCLIWDDVDYTYRKPININHNLIGGALEDFPICISILSDTDLSNNSESTNGYDIIFYDCQGNLLDHELNYYSKGSLIAWVKIPEIDNHKNKPIRMYYGNSDITTDLSTCDTWSNGYVMVLHMDDKADNTHISDSACHHYIGIKEGDAGDVCDEVSWGIHKAQHFDCTKHQLIRINGVTNDITDKGTVSVWWENDGDNPYGTAGCLVSYRYNSPLLYYTDGENLQTAWRFGEDMPVSGNYTAYKTLSENVKYYTAFTWKDGEYWWYTDNITLHENWIITPWAHGNATSFIGYYSANQHFCGYIDEVRVADKERTRAWLVTEYQNQLNPRRFFSIGDEETYSYETCIFTITSESYTLTFNQPDYNNKDGKINNNIDVFNFVMGDVNALNKGLNSNMLTMSGKEYAKYEFTSIINKFDDMESLMDNHEHIAISGLGDCFNGDYVIEDFNYVISWQDYMAFRWVMTLEKKPEEE